MNNYRQAHSTNTSKRCIEQTTSTSIFSDKILTEKSISDSKELKIEALTEGKVCIFTLDEIPDYDKTSFLSVARFSSISGCRRLVGIEYYNLDSLKDWLDHNNTDPVTRESLNNNALRSRMQLALLARSPGDQEFLSVDVLAKKFLEFLKDPAVFKEKQTFFYHKMRRDLHIGDVGILSSWAVGNPMHNRGKAVENLKQSSVGTWLIRPSSLQSSTHFKVYVISWKSDADVILHLPIAHCYGYGYIILSLVLRGAKMPDISNAHCMPVHEMVYPSFIDLLESFSVKRRTLKLSMIRLNDEEKESILQNQLS